jgi:diguanylate cyclase (GGDEF)-like protein
MSLRSGIYVGIIILLGVTLTIGVLFLRTPATPDWTEFLILVTLASAAQLFKAVGPTHQIFHTTLLFFFASLILLDPFYFILVVLVSHLLEWAKERLTNSPHLKDWYIQPFNIAMHIIVGLMAYVVYQTLLAYSPDASSPIPVIAGLLAAVVYVTLNHMIIGLVLVLARGVTWKESGVMDLDNLGIDFAMLVMGYAVAILIDLNPWLALPALSPLYLIYRSLAVPQLKHQANTDPKTGLWNADYFMNALEVELSRAYRFNRQLTVVVADMDLLRNINNNYGHVAGDAVLVGIAQIMKQSFRDYDVVARFGGEEFSILMPETEPTIAYAHIESVRAQIEAAEFRAPTTNQVIKATMSFGIAGIHGGDIKAKEIIHMADLAMYAAKKRGRNCTNLYSPASVSFPSNVTT